MKTRWMLMATTCVALGCLTLKAADRPNAGGGPIQHIIDNAKELNLTDDQKTKLQALVKDFTAGHDASGMREKAKNNPELRETLKEMKAAKDSGDEAKMKELRQKLMSETGGAAAGKDGAKGAGAGAGHGEFIQKLAQILTPDQMQKLKDMREAGGGGAGGRGSKPDTSSTDKANKPDASKGVPKPFE